MTQFSVATTWLIEAPFESVWDATYESERWPSWWPYVVQCCSKAQSMVNLMLADAGVFIAGITSPQCATVGRSTFINLGCSVSRQFAITTKATTQLFG